MDTESVGLIAVSESEAKRVGFKGGGKVKAHAGTKYLLQIDDTTFAPGNVTVKRDGKDLQVFFEGSDKPDLTITDFFAEGMDAQLYGASEGNELYAYVRTDGEGFHGLLTMADGEMAPIALGGNPLGAAPLVNGEITESSGFLLWPLLAAVGAGGAYAATKDDDKKHTKTSASVTNTRVTDHVGPIQGDLANDGITDDNRPSISGDGVPGAIVHILDNGVEIGSTTVGQDGKWNFVPASDLSNGGHSIDITQNESGKKPGTPVHVIDFSVDTAPPTAPFAEIEGAVIHDGEQYSPNNKPIIDGKGAPGDTIIITYPTGETVTVEVRDDGTWVAPPPTQPLPEDGAEIKVKERDPAGNETEITLAVIIDTIAPDAPKAWLDPASDTGIKDDGITSNTTPTIDGKTEPGADVTVTFPTGELIHTTADQHGDWSVTPTKPLPDGNNAIKVEATDAAGNTSKPTVITIDIDTHKPNALQLDSVIDDIAPITGEIHKGDYTNDSKPTFNGSGAEANTQVKVYDNGVLIGSTTANADGKWSYEPAIKLEEGDHNFQFSGVDVAGNEGAKSAPFDFIVDSIAPDAPHIDHVIDRVGDITGEISNAVPTDDRQPEVSGSSMATPTTTPH
ncbi:hypothetical protein UB43_20660 [Pseudomonas sp. 21]|uniref:Ig-like domain-containing protein n=1 Tax=Pseudomonas sp. 21 TaxID=1619948 RepID=UPI0005EB3DE3|nr:Ig-like domain-containing protein [Pseudomonas sp. 21]KJJ97928.1 hypothetical protein UB43_20660 [Pseudomonas sp. 21]